MEKIYKQQVALLLQVLPEVANEKFTYDDYEINRRRLIDTIYSNLTSYDKEFLLGVKNLTPDWSVYNFQHFPSIIWKLQNCRT